MRIQESVSTFRFNLEDVTKFRNLAKNQGIYQKDLFKIIVNAYEDSTNNENTLLEDKREHTAL